MWISSKHHPTRHFPLNKSRKCCGSVAACRSQTHGPWRLTNHGFRVSSAHLRLHDSKTQTAVIFMEMSSVTYCCWSFTGSCFHFEKKKQKQTSVSWEDLLFPHGGTTAVSSDRGSQMFTPGSIIPSVIWACWGVSSQFSPWAGQTSRDNKHVNEKRFIGKLMTFSFSKQSYCESQWWPRRTNVLLY